MLKFKNNGLTKVLAVISAICIIFTIFAAVPFVIEADNTEKMFVISSNASGETLYSNVFVPLDFTEIEGQTLSDANYFKLSFKAKLENDKLPIIGVVRYYSIVRGPQAEPDYANNNLAEHSDEVIYTSYNPKTMMFTAVVKMWITASVGNHTALTIGNVEHSKSTHSESNFDASFAFAEPELYLYDTTTQKTSGPNLLPAITDSNYTGDVYKHAKNGYNKADGLLKAPTNKWSVDTNSSLVGMVAIPDGYFNASTHDYEKVPAKEATKTEKGVKEHYVCKCGDCDDKYYLDLGITEVDYEDLLVEYDFSQETDKMFVIKPNKSGETKYANVFIPLDFRQSGETYFDSRPEDKYYYFKLTFKAKLSNEKMPIIGMIRSDPYGDKWGSYSEFSRTNNNQESHSDTLLVSSYDSKTLTYTAIIKMYIDDKYSANSTKAHTAITIGNMEHNDGWYKEHNFDASFAFAYPELYAYDTTTQKTYGDNLIASICDKNVNSGKVYKHEGNPDSSDDHIMSAPVNKWSIDTTESLISLESIPVDYFEPNNHNFTRVPLKPATTTETGLKAHYVCDCDKCVDKYYLKAGFDEVKYEDLIIPVEKPQKMIVVSPSNGQQYANAFIPLDFLEVDGVRHHSQESDKYYYFKLSFKLKLLNGKMPIVGVVRYGYWHPGAQAEFSYVNNNQDGHDDKILMSSYDEETLMYTAIIKLWINEDPATGNHTALTIGNMEHNDSYYKESNFGNHFAFTEPKLYAYDTEEEKIYGENLIAPINDDTFTGDVYQHLKNGYNEEDALLKAPSNKWSIDTTASLVTLEEIPENFFKPSPHKFTKVPGVAATKDTVGYKEHYVCECEECGEPKYFLDKGYTEVEYEDLILPALGEDRMFVISPNASGGTKTANVFIPLNFRQSGETYFDSKPIDKYYYFKLTFKLKILGNSMPIVGMMRYNPYNNLGAWSEFNRVNNNQLEHDDQLLYSEYDPETMIYTAVVKMWIDDRYSSSPTGAHSAITIGNMEHNNNWRSEYNFDASFAFCDPKLYAYDTETGKTYGENLITGIHDVTFNEDKVYQHLMNDYADDDNLMAAPPNMWSVDGTKSMISIEEIPDNYFVPTEGTPHMVIFDGKNDSNSKGTNGRITQKVELVKGKKYKLSYNAKYASTGLEGDKLGGQLEYHNGTEYVELASVKSESDTEYKEFFEFTMPDDAKDGSNFRFFFNYSSAFTSGYMANFELYEVDADGKTVGKNLFKNGDFSVGGISMWTKEGSSYRFLVTEIPENYFSKTTSNKANMAIYRNTSDFAQIFQMPTLKPNTKYEFKHTGLHVDYASDKKPYGIVYQYYKDEKGNNVNGSIPSELVEKTETENSVSMVFTTYETLRTDGDNNALIRVYMRSDSAGFWANFELYELDEDGNRIGNNLFLNPDFACGFETWTLQGEYNLRLAEIPDGFFENYTEPTEMVYATGKEKDQLYSSEVKVDADKKYYYTGYYVNMNSAGINPQIQYLPSKNAESGEYVNLDAEVFYDSDRYYFEVAFEIPNDALIKDGEASIRIQINNMKYGKGYFTELMLAEDGKYVNLLSDFVFENNGSYELMPYDAGVFIFYYDDMKFDDGDWSGEIADNQFNITYGSVVGRVSDLNGYGVSECTMKLMPGNITTKTDDFGSYAFDEVEPGNYKLYLVESSGNELYCMDVEVKRGISSMLPLFYYYTETVIVDDGSGESGTPEPEIPSSVPESSSEEETSSEESVSSEESTSSEDSVSSEIPSQNEETDLDNSDTTSSDNNSSVPEVTPPVDNIYVPETSPMVSEPAIPGTYIPEPETNYPVVNVPVVDIPVVEEAPVVVPETTVEYGIMRGFYYTTKGKTISGATICLRNHGSVVTDANGMFMFENVIPGEYEVYTILADGSEYVFRTVVIEANKGVQIKIMEPVTEKDKNINSTLVLIIIIISAAIVIIAAASVVLIILMKKKKNAKV